MQKDGLTGRVSDHLDDDRIIPTRPKDHGFVRITHFPWDSPPWGPTRFDRHSEEAIEISYGEVFEVSVYGGRETIARTECNSPIQRPSSERPFGGWD